MTSTWDQHKKSVAIACWPVDEASIQITSLYQLGIVLHAEGPASIIIGRLGVVFPQRHKREDIAPKFFICNNSHRNEEFPEMQLPIVMARYHVANLCGAHVNGDGFVQREVT